MSMENVFTSKQATPEELAELVEEVELAEIKRQAQREARPKVINEVPDVQVEWEDLEHEWAHRKEDDVMNMILQGRQGLNFGMDNGLNHINTYIHGTHQARYILIGADSGVGKTTLADFMYVYSLWLACRKAGKKLYIKYFSFEISKAEKKLKWIAQWIKHVYHEDLSTDYIAGRIPGLLLSDNHLQMVMKAYAVVEEVLKDVEIYDQMLHPTGILNRFLDHYEKIGTIHRAEVSAEDAKKGKKGMIKGYSAKDPTAMTVGIIDHLALTAHEKGAFTKKDIMDRLSMYGVQLRNIFRATLVFIQQFNTSQMSAYREQKRSEAAIAPGRLDFGDSSYTYRDADVVIGLVKPVQYDLKTYYGFNLEDLGQYFLALHLMKNRYGPADRMVPIFMNPIAGMFKDIPLSITDPALPHYINEAKRIEALCQQFSQQGQTP